MIVGDVVIPQDGFALRSGCMVYSHAIIASVQPFVLVSEDGDMRWSATIKAADFKVIGSAKEEAMICVWERLYRDRKNGIDISK